MTQLSIEELVETLRAARAIVVEDAMACRAFRHESEGPSGPENVLAKIDAMLAKRAGAAPLASMKLFVVNENTPDPNKWSIWSELEIVVAEDAQSALALCPGNNGLVCEIPMNEPRHLIKLPEPNWGEDL